MNQPIQENKEEYKFPSEESKPGQIRMVTDDKGTVVWVCTNCRKGDCEDNCQKNTSREEKPIKEFIANLLASRDAALLEFIESTKTKYPIDSRKISSTEIAINWANPLAHEVLDLVASHIRHDL